MTDQEQRDWQLIGAFFGLIDLARKGLITTEFFLKRCMEIADEYKENNK